MNRANLTKAGIPEHCLDVAIDCIRAAAGEGLSDIHGWVVRVVAQPDEHVDDFVWANLACALVDEQNIVPREPIDFKQWGKDIEPQALEQMRNACRLPVALKAAVMPDAHLGYGVPIGCVLATYNAVIPNAVGVDIGCRMKLSIFNAPPLDLESRRQELRDAIREETRFGKGCEFENPRDHPVMDDPSWKYVTQEVNSLKDLAHRQLGTSGGGNHFVEFGIAETAMGNYLALLTHSGSRGMGSKIATKYHRLAKKLLSHRDQAHRELAWLDLDTEPGQKYWEAMNLAGRYAAANHDCIHDAIAGRLGLEVASTIENHHNLAWVEHHDDRWMVVHRKGAMLAGKRVLGIIPGDMLNAAFLVTGKGVAASLNSASHGAGRAMSRTQAKLVIIEPMALDRLKTAGVELMSGGHDELPGSYKDIYEVMAAQRDLVDVVGRFYPRIVCMDGKRR